MSLYNTPLMRREFPNEYHRRESIQKLKNDQGGQYDEIRLFENIGAQQQFLVDQYHQQNSDVEFSKFPI